jgi:hypothetical protein
MTTLNITLAAPEVQTAVLAALTGNAPHMALVSGVFDAVAQGTAYPYEAIGALQENWADGFTDGFRSGMLQLDVWSQYHGRKEAQDIQQSQIALLNRQPLALATLHLVYLRLDYADVLEDPDAITWHGVTRYTWLVEATS